ncbi:MAG: PH domain-containing protein [Acidimicrobiia bacterium]
MPAYPAHLINEGETVVLDLKPHWFFFIKNIVFGAVLALVFIVWIGPLGGLGDEYVGWPLAAVFVGYAGWVVYRYFVWAYTHFVLTDRRVISRSGIVSKRGTEIPLERINNIDFSQRLLERALGAGDLSIESAGREGQSHFENVRHPDAVQQEIYRQMETNAKRQASWSMPPVQVVPTAAAAGGSVADQIKELAELRDQGHITVDEYEAKKAQLLERM